MPLYYKIPPLYKIDNHPPKHVCDNMLFSAMIVKKFFFFWLKINFKDMQVIKEGIFNNYHVPIFETIKLYKSLIVCQKEFE